MVPKRRRPSRRPLIELENATQPLPTLDGSVAAGRVSARVDKSVVETLMVPLEVIMLRELSYRRHR